MNEPSSYLKYLPGIYRVSSDETDSPPFVAYYLKIFEKILTGIDDEYLNSRKGIQQLFSADVIGHLFYPRFSFLFEPDNRDFIPPISGAQPEVEKELLFEFNRYIGVEDTADQLAGFVSSHFTGDGEAAFKTWLNDFLVWLGSWVGLVVDNEWSIDKKRQVIAEILALYRLRGTPQGCNFLLNLVFDLPQTLQGFDYSSGQPQKVEGPLTIQLSQPAAKAIVLRNQASDGFILNQRYHGDMPVTGGFKPWLYLLELVLPNKSNSQFILTSDSIQKTLSLLEKVEQLLPAIQPANTRWKLQITPSMQLQPAGRASQLGNNTLLGQSSIG